MITTSSLSVANHEIGTDLAWSSLLAGCRACADVVRWYDCAGGDQMMPAGSVDLPLLGRLSFLGLEISPADAVGLVESAAHAPWAPVPTLVTLVQADPAGVDGLYDRAEELHRHFLHRLSRNAAPIVAAMLHPDAAGSLPRARHAATAPL